jgi:hypothetical protein
VLKTEGRATLSRFVCLFSLALMLLVSAGAAEKPAEYTVSISNVRVSAGESVVSFEIDVTAGAFESVSDVPVGWYLTVDNDASWQTKIKANTTVGAAALKPEDLRKLRFKVKKNEFGDLKFDLAGTVSVTKDYQKERPLHLKMSDFALTPKP